MNRRQRPTGSVATMLRHQIGDRQISNDVAVGHHERLATFMQARSAGREPDGTGSIKRRIFDRVGEPYAGTHRVGVRAQERLGFETQREHGIGNSPTCQVHHEPLKNRSLAERQQRLGNGVGERTQSRSETTDKHYGVHAALDLLAGVDEQRYFAGCRRLINFGSVRSKDERHGETVIVQTNGVKVGNRCLA